MDYRSTIPIAKKFADQYQDKQYNHVSLILIGKSIAAIGTNIARTNPMNLKYYPKNNYFEHSELNAWMQVKNISSKKKILINFRFRKNGDLALSAPCIYCMSWCIDVFEHIYYSTNENQILRLY